MADLNSALAESRAALEQLIAAAERSGASWTTPRAPGKWSPSQITEHVARALEESGKNIKGEPNMFPSLPALVRLRAAAATQPPMDVLVSPALSDFLTLPWVFYAFKDTPVRLYHPAKITVTVPGGAVWPAMNATIGFVKC